MLRKFILLTVLGVSLGLGVNIQAGQAAPLSPTPIAAESETIQVSHRRHHHHHHHIRRHHHHHHFVPHVRRHHHHHHHHHRRHHHHHR